MGAWFRIDGIGTFRRCAELDAAVATLDSALIGVEPELIDHDDPDMITIAVSCEDSYSHGSINEIVDALMGLKPFVAPGTAALFETWYEDEPGGDIWLGDPEDVARAQSERAAESFADSFRQMTSENKALALSKVVETREGSRPNHSEALREAAVAVLSDGPVGMFIDQILAEREIHDAFGGLDPDSIPPERFDDIYVRMQEALDGIGKMVDATAVRMRSWCPHNEVRVYGPMHRLGLTAGTAATYGGSISLRTGCCRVCGLLVEPAYPAYKEDGLVFHFDDTNKRVGPYEDNCYRKFIKQRTPESADG